ncbi:MAG: GDP-mannose 4,6-dehydratase, partial [Candidatus Diapherotrites archaeon]|nr:GDP-mannose 4,6-dehydratase [Candidatus Diapherotrites archaeon]
MRVLITGIGGFIGKHLAGEAMSADKAEVFGTILPGEKADFSGFEKGGLKILECDINDAERLGSIVMEVQPDIVFHLAAIANVYLSWAIPEKTAKVNLLGSLNLLEAVRKYAPDARVLLSSTREVYGAVKKSELPITEKQEPNPMNPYAVSKLAMEMLGRNYCNNYGLKAVILRSFNITGPGRPSEFACSDWAKQVAEIDLGRREPVIET